ncbi:RNA ligase [Streptomyces sp. NPDC057552]|uniref:RNA ligase n=1 Tax=Streptomyces sp. NPDC057552 TaxID=3350537 RepID=UPI0036A04AF7
MPSLDTLFPRADLARAIKDGYVSAAAHPELPLTVYAYTRLCQYAAAWTPVTIRCRGLIVDDTDNQIVAWPFEKFFNTAEHDLDRPYAPPLPDEPFRIYDKVDGSLGIVFHYAGKWRAATRGAFISDEARWAQRWLDSHDTAALVPGITYLAELVFPQNRIVVHYGDRQDMVLIGAYDRSGTDLELHHIAAHWQRIGSVVRTWPAMPLADLLTRTEANRLPDGTRTSGLRAEGFVLRFTSGVRAKAKLSEYTRLHSTLKGIGPQRVWKAYGLQKFAHLPPKKVAKAFSCPESEARWDRTARGPLEDLLHHTPDELDTWVRSVVAQLEDQAAHTHRAIDDAFDRLDHLRHDRPAFAAAANRIEDATVRAGVFHRLDGRSAELTVWHALKPAYAEPFQDDTGL